MRMNWAALYGADRSYMGAGWGGVFVPWRDLTRSQKRAFIRYSKSI
jgi:hypothetical protein